MHDDKTSARIFGKIQVVNMFWDDQNLISASILKIIDFAPKSSADRGPFLDLRTFILYVLGIYYMGVYVPILCSDIADDSSRLPEG